MFDSELVYGLEPNLTFQECVLYGRTLLKVYQCDSEKISFKKPNWKDCGDWILAAKWIDNDDNIATLLMHNFVILWTKTLTKLTKVACEEQCISYSGHLVNDTWENLVALSGTVFSAILIYQPSKTIGDKVKHSPVICRLSKHQGSIFSIDYNAKSGIICSTSDDRSAIIWSVPSKDLLKELAKEELQIKPIRVLYGHTSRVFRCRVLEKYILTAGEDSLINVWNNNGKSVRQIRIHQGSPLWSLDCDGTLLVTGAGDSGVMVFTLHNTIARAEMNERNEQEYPTKLVLLRNGMAVAISDKGELQYHNGDKWNLLARHADLISYALLEVSYCRNLIGLAGIAGTIHIYKLADVPKELYFHQIEDKSRIYSFHWLSCKYYLTCSEKGVLRLWRMKSKSPHRFQQFKLPKTNERWSTAACFCSDKCMAVGDRKGHIYLYSLDTDLVNPVQTLKKAHNHLGVAHLFYSERLLTSLGRDSIIKKYCFNYEQGEPSVTLMISDKLPFSWLAKMCTLEDNLLIAGFRENDFILWDCRKRSSLLQVDCGGGHRSWDFYKNGTFLDIVYIKDKIIHLVRYNWESVHVGELVSSFHANTINSIIGIPLMDGKVCIFISGGEDTTLRIGSTDFKFETCFKSNFQMITALKSHLSSIRVIRYVQVNDNTYYMFSGGGRAQIIFWEIVIDVEESPKIECTEITSVNTVVLNTKSETRVMDLCVVLKDTSCTLLSASSDGAITVFRVKANDPRPVVPCGNVAYKSKCIFKISHLEVFKHDILMSMATDGKIVFWDFTHVIRTISLNKVVPFDCIYAVQAHQSGINSFTKQKLTDDTYMFLTGGDDHALVIHICKFHLHRNKIKVEVLSHFKDSSSHCSQITGTYIGQNHFLTVSVDQRLNIFKYKIINNKMDCKLIRRHNSSIADIHGMLCFDNGGHFYVLLYGIGVELCKVVVGKT